MIRQLAISGFLVLPVFSALQVGLAQEFRPLSKGTPTSVENFVQEMFFITKSSGSLTLSGTCKATNVDKDVVGDALPHPPQGPFQNLSDAMTALSQIDPHLSWIRDAGGLLRVSDDRVSDDVLRIRLQRVHFRGAVDANEAIREVLSAPEVRSYFKENHIEDGTVFNSLMPMSTKGLPRLSGDLQNVTVAEALDRVIRFFPGLWIYSECRYGSLRRVMVRGSTVGGSPGR
jgi:hypothetical protein